MIDPDDFDLWPDVDADVADNSAADRLAVALAEGNAELVTDDVGTVIHPDGVVISGPEGVITLETSPTPPPIDVAAVVRTADDGKAYADVSWTVDPEEYGADSLVGFEVLALAAGSTAPESYPTPTGSPTTIGPLEYATSYTVWLVAYDRLGEKSVASDTEIIATPDAPPVVGTIAVVATLPTSDMVEGDVVYLTTDKKLYRYDADVPEWTSAVDGSDIIVNSVTADKVNAATLSALAANLGWVNIDSAGGWQAGNENTTPGAANYVQGTVAGLRFYVGGDYDPSPAAGVPFYTGGTLLLNADAVAGNLTVGGEFDTSSGGTGDGIRIIGDEVQFFDTGLQVGLLATDTDKLLIQGRGPGVIPTINMRDDTNGISIAARKVTVGAHEVVRLASNLGTSEIGVTAAGDILLSSTVGIKVGAGGTPIKDRRILKPAYDPASLAANTGAVWDIPIGATLPGAATDWTVVYCNGLANGTTSLIVPVACTLLDLSTIRLYVRNVHASLALDLGSRTFEFIAERT